ncbi:uncharacterized protein VTP21DRAFT_5033 [Calcarisporiella thermophila]|uniref:uncharacterized protein n=1 Tax=Calcarisporiella thermophila TaxID=911321 RepID=UPI0037439109
MSPPIESNLASTHAQSSPLSLALGGFAIVLHFMSWRKDHVITSNTARYFVLAAFPLVGVFVAAFNEPLALQIGLAAMGATATIIGVDFVANGGVLNSFWDLIDDNPSHRIIFNPQWRTYVELSAQILLFLIGFAASFLVVNRGRPFGVRLRSESEPTLVEAPAAEEAAPKP